MIDDASRANREEAGPGSGEGGSPAQPPHPALSPRGGEGKDDAPARPDDAPAGSPGRLTARDAGVALALAVLTGLIFSRALGGGFVEFDDNVYVTLNPWVQGGLSTEGLRQAWTRTVGSNWHPLTMISHQVDCHLFGLDPRGHHLTSVVLHALNTALVYLLWTRFTGRWGAALLAAAIWGWHPLRVESVAWIAERKDLLSGLFGLLALGAYGWWCERPSSGRYLTCGLLLGAGLLSKSMLVTWPCVMLLCDAWPLGRWTPWNLLGDRSSRGEALRRCAALVAEKWLFWLLVFSISLVTLGTQSRVAVRSLGALPLGIRVGNALASYVDYLGNFVWPTGLACFYPHPGTSLAWSNVVVGAVVVAGATLAAWRLAPRQPYLLVGWLWYLGTLVPVIGLVQVGGHARADRFTYLPQVGLAVALAWAALEWAGHSVARRRGVTAAAVVWLAAMAALTWQQIGVWRDTETLFRRAAAVTEGNFVAHGSLGNVLAAREDFAGALVEYERTLAIQPDDQLATLGLAYCLSRLDRGREAVVYYQRSVARDGSDPRVRLNYAELLFALARHREAREEYVRVLAQLEPRRDPASQALVAEIKKRLATIDEGPPRDR